MLKSLESRNETILHDAKIDELLLDTKTLQLAWLAKCESFPDEFINSSNDTLKKESNIPVKPHDSHVTCADTNIGNIII